MFRIPDFITSIGSETGLGRSGLRPAKVTDCYIVYCLCDIKVCVPQPQSSAVITSLHAFVERLSQGVRVSALRKVTDCSPNGHDAITSSQNPANVILSQVGKERPMSFYKRMKNALMFFGKLMFFYMCLQQEIHSFSTIENGSRPRGSMATAIKTPWNDGEKNSIKIEVSQISCQPQARLVKLGV